MTNTSTLSTDPRHQFLTRKETYMRYRRSRTAGYAFLTQPGFPPPIGDCYRLDQLMAWEDGHRWPTGSSDTSTALNAPVTAVPALPGRKKPGRKPSAEAA